MRISQGYAAGVRSLLCLLLLTTVNISQAFEARAHIAVCDLAWQRVQPQTREWIKQTLIDSPFKRFDSACPWPDQARDQKQFKDTGPWHYINVPSSAKRIKASDCPASGCILSALKDTEEQLLNKDSDWQALLFFSHFIADLHQPLHVSYADDRGGNQAKIKYMGEWTNLHRIWDGQLLGMYSISGLLDDWQKSPLPASVAQGSYKDWATESLTLTREIYAAYRQNPQPGEEYQQKFAPLLEQRLQVAGTRLAAQLDQIAAARNRKN